MLANTKENKMGEVVFLDHSDKRIRSEFRSLCEGAKIERLKLERSPRQGYLISEKGWQTLVEAVNKNRILSTLELRDIEVSISQWSALIDALRANVVTSELRLWQVRLPTESYVILAEALNTNQSLLTLE